MLNIKKGGRNVYYSLLAGLLAIFLAGCTEPGPRALLDGDRLLQEGKAEAAVTRLEEAVQHLPQNARAWNHLGLAYHQVGNVEKAAQAYQKAISFDRNLATARFNLGCLYLEQNHTAEAIAQLTTYVNLDSKKLPGWVKLGTAQLHHAAQFTGLEKTKMLEAARKSFEASLHLGSTAEAHNGLGLIEVQRGRARDAVRHFNAALLADSKHGPALLNLAIVYHSSLREPRAALQKYREYLASQPVSNEYREVEGVARRLDLELNPPVVVVTNVVPPQSPAPAPVAAPKPQPKPEAPKVSPKTSEPVAATPRTTQPTPPTPRTATTAKPTPPPQEPLEIVKVQDEPVTVAQDQPPATQPEVPRSSTPEPAPEEKPARTAAVEPEKEPEEKKSLLKKINPANWFRGKSDDSKTNEPAVVKPAPKPVAVVAPKPAPEPRREATYARYQYIAPAKAKSGNRGAAMSFFNEAIGAQRSGNLARAMESYRAALRADPAFFEAHYNFGLAAFQAGDLSASLHAYESALALSPESIDARYNFALALQRANFPVDAANELEKLLARRPNEVRAHLSLANLYTQPLSKPDKARFHYQEVLRLDPQHSQAAAIRHWLRNNP